VNQLVISPDLERGLEDVRSALPSGSRMMLFETDEFKVDDAHSVIEAAYLASEQEKFLIIKATAYNHYSQNALLKILEEPPRNISIVLIGPSRSIFLPTIRSRLPMRTVASKREKTPLEFDFQTLDLGAVYAFTKENRFLGKDDARRWVEEAFAYFKTLPPRTPAREKEILDLFDRSFRLLGVGGNGVTLITALMLRMLEYRDDNASAKRR